MLGVSGRQQEAIDIGIEVLAQLGEKFPSHIRKAYLMKEMNSVKRRLHGKSDEQLLRMPQASNGDKLACFRIMHTIYISALICRPTFAPALLLRWIKLTIDYGLSAFSSVAFANYGMLCVSSFKDIDSAYRYGKLGISLLERYKTNEYLSRVYFAFYGCIFPWKRPIAKALEPLMTGYRTGLRTGDIEGAIFCANFYVHFAFESGMDLNAVVIGWKTMYDTVTTNRLRSMLSFVVPAYQMVQKLMGVSDDALSGKSAFLKIDDEPFDLDIADTLDTGTNEHASFSVINHVLKLICAYMDNDYKRAARELTFLNFVKFIPPTVKKMSALFFAGMAALAGARRGDNPRKNIRMARSLLKELNSWRTKSPHNVMDKIFLLEAELASVCGQNAKAKEKYLCAIALAEHSHFGLMIGLAQERAAHHIFTMGDYEEARSIFEEACVSYRDWGGKRKFLTLRAEINTMYSTNIQEQRRAVP